MFAAGEGLGHVINYFVLHYHLLYPQSPLYLSVYPFLWETTQNVSLNHDSTQHRLLKGENVFL